MIGFSLGPVGRAVQKLVGGAVTASIEYLGASPGVSVTSNTATMVLPATGQAGDIVVMAVSSNGTLSSTSPSGSVEIVAGAPRIRAVRLVGGETQVTWTNTGSTGLRYRALHFRPSLKTSFAAAGAFSATATSTTVSQAASTLPAIAIAAGTHTSTGVGAWEATIPGDYTVVENTPYSASNLRALYLAFKILQPGDTGTGNILIDVANLTNVAYASVITPT